MKLFPDSCLGALVAAALLAGPAFAVPAPDQAPVHKASARKTAAKPAAAAAVPAALNAGDLMTQARLAQSRGDNELAVRLAQSAIVVGPDRSDTYDALGDVYVAQNEPDFARSYYNEALSIDPADAAAQKAIAGLDHGASDQRAANTQGSQTGTP
jgi:tetratricopeptide (TPR) repeat protein